MYPLIPSGRLEESNAFFANPNSGAGYAPDMAYLATNRAMPKPVATLQNKLPASIQTDRLAEADALAEYLPQADQSLSDQELLKQQWSRAPGMFDSSQATMQPDPAGVYRMNYGDQKPVRGGAEELLNDPRFHRLLRSSPQHAEQAFQAIAGGRMGDYLQERDKQNLARTKDFEGTIRGRVMKGDVRQHPEFGYMEELISEPDPSGIGKSKPAWRAMELEAQQAYTKNWQGAMGGKLQRSNPIMDLDVTPHERALIWEKWTGYMKAGTLDPQAALNQAILDVPKQSQAQQMGPVQGPPVPTATQLATKSPVSANAPRLEEGEDAYNLWASNQNRQSIANLGNTISEAGDAMAGGYANAVDKLDWAGEDINRYASNMIAGVGNIPARISSAFGGNPKWMRPTSHPEMIARYEAQKKVREENEKRRQAQMLIDGMNPGPVGKAVNWFMNIGR